MKSATLVAAIILTAAGVQAQEAGGAVTLPALAGAGRRGPVTGRPVSGIEEQKSTETLSDGTVISNSSNDNFYRDSSGRTRVDSDTQGIVSIVDPVARVSVTLMAETKTARRFPLGDAERTAWSIPVLLKGSNSAESGPITYRIFTRPTGDARLSFTFAGGLDVGIAANSSETKVEVLGVESLNGVLANHTRSTSIIPKGKIGNDRDIHVVNDKWYSDDLQMLVKTVNSDPRFGENTYELTDISRDEPDPALFQIPPDYIVQDMGPTRAPAGPNK